ncbi:MAG: glycosyltransferase [bacterium]|nr:glycosyltransferase [bacterium]
MAHRLVELIFPVGSSRRQIAAHLKQRVKQRVARMFATVLARRSQSRPIPDAVSQSQQAPQPQQAPAGVTYQQWWCRLPPDSSVLDIQKGWYSQWVRPTTVWVLVVADGGDVDTTQRWLHQQSWGATEMLVVTPQDMGRELSRLHLEHSQDMVVVLRAGDVLRPDAAFRIAQAVWRDPWLELVYWDHDLTPLADVWAWHLDGMPEGVYFGDDLEGLSQPRLKPEWSPDLLVCANYIGRAFAVRARQLSAEVVQGFESIASDDDLAWWALLLSLDVGPQQVSRLAAVLQAQRVADVHYGERHEALVDGWLNKHGWAAKAEATDCGIKLNWTTQQATTVSIIVPTCHNREMLQGCFELIRSASYSGSKPTGSKPTGIELIIVDNGGRKAANEAWYRYQAADLHPQIIWWDEPFNYSAVNNRAASRATGDVLVFLNDDTSVGHPDWLQNLVGWAQCPEIGVAGLQLLGTDGMIQHGGVVIGMTGLAGHLFCGMAPHSESLMGPTDWTRNTVAVTGACLAVRRSVFSEVGGFDERMELCGSDVVLGLRAYGAGYRNVVSAVTPIGHRESATRGSDIPEGDVFASYWSYQRWLMGGDPYFSPNLSAGHPEPRICCESKPGVLTRLTEMLGRPMEIFYQRNETGEAHVLSVVAEADRELAESVRRGHRAVRGRHQVKTVNWFVPEFQNPFYGGIHTVFRLADHLAANHGVQNRFMVMAGPTGHDERWYRSGITAAFSSLADSPISYHDSVAFDPCSVPPADAAIATMWNTAYFAARTPAQTRRFYLIQDFEPMFYPAGTLYALAEHSYRLGLYGLCNTGHLADLYRDRYGGTARHFWPAVDTSIFHARNRIAPDTDRQANSDRPATVFIYARPGHLRNCWELAARAVHLLKEELADGVRIVTAGSWAFPEHMDSLITHVGQLDYAETGPLYRTCDIGVALTTSEHPSYLPLELMACGTAVVAFENPAGEWLLRHNHNCMQSPQTADALAAEIAALVRDPARRQRLAAQGVADIAARHASWQQNLAGVYEHLCDPEPQT